MVMPDGRTSFAALQQAAAGTASHTPLVYFVFDLLRLDGERLDRLPLEERKARLRALVGLPPAKAKAGRIRYAEHIVGGGEKLFEHATQIGLEGIISKRRDLPYQPGRHDSWRKSKVIQRGVVRDRRLDRSRGHARRDRCTARWLLRWAATGLRRPRRHRLLTRVRARAARSASMRSSSATCPFDPPMLKGPERLAHWVKPMLVCEVAVHRVDERRAAAPPGVRARCREGREAEETRSAYFFCCPAAGPSPGCGTEPLVLLADELDDLLVRHEDLVVPDRPRLGVGLGIVDRDVDLHPPVADAAEPLGHLGLLGHRRADDVEPAIVAESSWSRRRACRLPIGRWSSRSTRVADRCSAAGGRRERSDGCRSWLHTGSRAASASG